MRETQRRLLLDTNIWIAFFLDMGALTDEITELVNSCMRNSIELLYAPTTLKDVFYIVPRQLKRIEEEKGEQTSPAARRATAWACAQGMREIATPAPLTGAECDLAHMLRSLNADLEDNLVVACAETCHADYIVTLDKQLIEAFSPSCVTPAQALSAIAVWEASR